MHIRTHIWLERHGECGSSILQGGTLATFTVFSVVANVSDAKFPAVQLLKAQRSGNLLVNLLQVCESVSRPTT